ncbi:MAG: hypothetical protein JRE23_14735 [Deltaproteobacteria bacterium]|nr:hypothetical protein [Deltaproteobacteria bacterium]
MPNCYNLYDKISGERMGAAKIDDLMCAYLDIDPDPVRFLCGWSDSVGLLLAIGQSFDEIATDFQAKIDLGENVKYYNVLLTIVAFLSERYTVDAFVTR